MREYPDEIFFGAKSIACRYNLIVVDGDVCATFSPHSFKKIILDIFLFFRVVEAVPTAHPLLLGSKTGIHDLLRSTASRTSR